MIVLDTSGLLAALDSAEPRHREAANSLRDATAPRLLSPFVLAELDFMIARRVGGEARLELLDDVARGVYRLEIFEPVDVSLAREIVDRYSALELSLADASIAVLAERHDVREVLTLDERDFRAMDGPRGKPFRLLPADVK